MPVSGAAPCQCFSPGGIQTVSPGRISCTGPSQVPTRPTPCSTCKVWPSDAYPAQLEKALRAKGLDVSVTNAGKNGDTSAGVLARLDSSVPAGTDVAIVSVGVNDVVLAGLSPETGRANVGEIAQRLRSRGMEVIVLPTGKKFQGSIADDPKYHVEGAGGGSGPVRGTTNWHLTPAGYAIVVARTLPEVMAAVARAQKKKRAKG